MEEKKRTNSVIFYVSAAIASVIALWGILGNASFGVVADRLMDRLLENFTWVYLWGVFFFVIFSFLLAVSPWGKIRLGRDDEKPEHSTVSWFAMLFGAGMGIGLVFWGVAEPLSHYIAPMKGIEPLSGESARFAMRTVFMHWGLHPWACYAVMGLGLAYYSYRKNQPALASSLMRPIFGSGRLGRIVGIAVDIFTAVLSAMAVATSFGMGCLQINGGLSELFGIPNEFWVLVIVVAIICAIYLRTAITGVDRGIKLLSDINLVLFLLLMALAYLVGDTLSSFKMGAIGLGDYVRYFLADSIRTEAQGDSSWIQAWRVFYWAWWLSWAPCVGIFIARISRGRTIRQYMAGVIVVPTVVSIFWFTAFGGLGLQAADAMPPDQLAKLAAAPEIAMYEVYALYPLGRLMSLIGMALVVTFFVTSANSATFVLAMLTSGGALNPPNSKKVFWGILAALLALALVASGGIGMIQTISIVIAFPYLIILILICFSVVLSLVREGREK